jgi:putative ABC transport system ATP-binding protein
MLNIIGTIDKPTKGEIRICDTSNLVLSENNRKGINSNTKDSDLSKIRLDNMYFNNFLIVSHSGFVFQTFNLLSSMTALENVEMPMILSGKLSQAERRQRAKGICYCLQLCFFVF